jgi:secondary thiamine-phosphate synthase enzyme
VVEIISVKTQGQGLYEITDKVRQLLMTSGVKEGLCSLLIQHTSASLTIQENADPSAQHDLENWLNRLVPEGDAIYTHVFEGRDDMPAHIKAALTATTLSLPVKDGQMLLGTWQGLFCWEHRHSSQLRRIAVHIG